MKSFRLLAATLALSACRQSDGAPAQGAAAASPAAQNVSDTARDSKTLERADAARIQGAANAPVWVVEISDFQCPYCKMWHDSVYPAIKKQYVDAGVVRMAYVNLPLSMHQNAVPAAEAAMCAAAQDKFWQMHDALFSTQDKWGTLDKPGKLLDSLATSVGVDGTAWRACMASGLMRRVINGDRARAAQTGARSTPTFFVGNQPILGAQPADSFRKYIELARTAKPTSKK
jgi:protein-disulfide isomerase